MGSSCFKVNKQHSVNECTSCLHSTLSVYFEPSAQFSSWNALCYILLSPSSTNGDTTRRHGCKCLWLIAGRDCGTLMYTNNGSECWINRESVCMSVSVKTIQIDPACVYICFYANLTGRVSSGAAWMPGRQFADDESMCVRLSFKYLLFGWRT